VENEFTTAMVRLPIKVKSSDSMNDSLGNPWFKLIFVMPIIECKRRPPMRPGVTQADFHCPRRM
jgi:hypothetical protein